MEKHTFLVAMVICPRVWIASAALFIRFMIDLARCMAEQLMLSSLPSR